MEEEKKPVGIVLPTEKSPAKTRTFYAKCV